jgi:hypothetical protein
MDQQQVTTACALTVEPIRFHERHARKENLNKKEEGGAGTCLCLEPHEGNGRLQSAAAIVSPHRLRCMSSVAGTYESGDQFSRERANGLRAEVRAA